MTIHHEGSCRIEISHLAESLVKFWPRGRDFSVLHGQAHDGLFLSHFSKVFCQNIKNVLNTWKFSLFTRWIYINFKLTSVFLGYQIVCTSLLTGKHDWRISLVVKCKIKSCFAPCAIGVTLLLLSCGALSVTSLMLYVTLTLAWSLWIT